ncbi:hypothetical protein LTR84_001403 [Exophiala bonariae]|uniref:Enoyl reductase (ER) domain-containing protein n=1 Tax=Exophiala bonariae TaxID=1690606 RepID=A0AAV9NC99_9EURO|nr:hypothetical protein LTR84_001403 [Exophiala bonariae]
MTTQKAVVSSGPGKAELSTNRPIPTTRPGYVLVDVKAVALNPTDWKHIDFIAPPNCVLGCDYAGVVAETGEGYDKQWKVGDRICGFVHGGNSLQNDDGSHQEKLVAKADIQIRIPDSLTFAEAATLGVAAITCGQGLFQSLGLNFPNNPKNDGEPILIYGGSSAMGTMGVQLAKLAGYKVISTSSPSNFALVKSFGADEVFDYSDPDCASKIKDYLNGKPRLAWDCISLEGSAKICADVLSGDGVYGSLYPVAFPRTDIPHKFTLGYTCFGEPVHKNETKINANPDDFVFMKEWIKVFEQLLADGKLSLHPLKVNHGLENVLDGVDLLRKNKVSGQKLVYIL